MRSNRKWSEQELATFLVAFAAAFSTLAVGGWAIPEGLGTFGVLLIGVTAFTLAAGAAGLAIGLNRDTNEDIRRIEDKLDRLIDEKEGDQ